jgi:hypothetical protein
MEIGSQAINLVTELFSQQQPEWFIAYKVVKWT